MNGFTKRVFKRAGFTLMEIMVVIIVIAVLASVAGPMIGSITDQGKSAATKAAMGNLKTALVNYNNDLGRFPHEGSTYGATAVNDADESALAATYDNNVLVNNEVSTLGFSYLGINAYNKRWKGPYMDSTPEEFMMDAWEAKIKYFHWNKGIYLQSAGPDGAMDKPGGDGTGNAAASDYEGDDILVSVSRVKF